MDGFGGFILKGLIGAVVGFIAWGLLNLLANLFRKQGPELAPCITTCVGISIFFGEALLSFIL